MPYVAAETIHVIYRLHNALCIYLSIMTSSVSMIPHNKAPYMSSAQSTLNQNIYEFMFRIILPRRSIQRIQFPRTNLQKANMSSDKSQASMLGGHAQYAKGYVEETVGNVTGSKEWQQSGKEDAKAGIDEMKVGCFGP